jgi:hypothetical protein
MAKAATKKTAKKSAAKKPAKKSARKVVAKKATRKGAVKKASAKKSARKVVAKKATRKGAVKKASAKKASAKRAPAKRCQCRPQDRQTRRPPPSRLARSDVSADQARLPAVRPRLISLFVLRVCAGLPLIVRGVGPGTPTSIDTRLPWGDASGICRQARCAGRCGRVAEGGGLLNRYRVVKLYRGFESLRLRQWHRLSDWPET